MSRSPYFYAEVYNNKENKWLYVDPLVWNYDRTKRVVADLWPYNGTHELFQLLGVEGGCSAPDFNGVMMGLPHDCCQEIKDAFSGEYFSPKWFTYADAEIYYLKHPEVDDPWEEPDEETGEVPKTDNPIKGLLDRVNAFLEVWDDMGIYIMHPSQIRIVFDVL